MSLTEIIVTIIFLGHACFMVETDTTSIMIDPYNETMGYDNTARKVDVVLVSHEHADHNNVKMAAGEPLVIRGLKNNGKDWEKIDVTRNDVHIYSVPAYHDETHGKKRGLNTIFIIESGPLRIVHLGDLGHVLTEKQVEEIGRVDVLMIPVGGYYTLDMPEQMKVVEQLKPRVTIPMHYKTAANPKMPIYDISVFKESIKNHRIIEMEGNALRISSAKGLLTDSKEEIKEPVTVILNAD